MAWLSITFEVEAAPAEALSDALIEAGAESVALEPAGLLTRVTVLAARDSDPGMLLTSAANMAGLPAPEFQTASLDDADWVRRSQAQFGPIRAAERIWIVPSWHAPPDAASVVLRLDPGLAFGTGSHPSTRLVLKFLERCIRGGERVLDYGCGSGILAIAAAKLGAGEIIAVDIDPQALDATASNAAANAVSLRVAAPDSLSAGTFDVVLANILAGPLIILEPLLAARTRPGGRIALSGILEAQAPEVSAAYERKFESLVAANEQGWALVEGRRR